MWWPQLELVWVFMRWSVTSREGDLVNAVSFQRSEIAIVSEVAELCFL